MSAGFHCVLVRPPLPAASGTLGASSSGSRNNGNPPLAGLFSGGMPQLRSRAPGLNNDSSSRAGKCCY